MNLIGLLPERILLDDLCDRIEAGIRIWTMTPSPIVNRRLVRKSVRLHLRSLLSSPELIQALRANIPLVSDQLLEDQVLGYWRRVAEMEHWRNEHADIDADDAVLFAKFEEIASQSALAAMRGG